MWWSSYFIAKVNCITPVGGSPLRSPYIQSFTKMIVTLNLTYRAIVQFYCLFHYFPRRSLYPSICRKRMIIQDEKELHQKTKALVIKRKPRKTGKKPSHCQFLVASAGMVYPWLMSEVVMMWLQGKAGLRVNKGKGMVMVWRQL